MASLRILNAVNKYGVDTLENMNAAAGSSKKSQKNDTVPSMLTPGEFVVSAPAVQKYGVDTMESMNAMGGGTNKPELKESDESVLVNEGGLIKNFAGGGQVDDGYWHPDDGVMRGFMPFKNFSYSNP